MIFIGTLRAYTLLRLLNIDIESYIIHNNI